MTLPPNFLDSYIQLLTKYRISESGTIRCGASCHSCPLHNRDDGSCEITNQADILDMPYEQFETSIVQPLVAKTHPELLI